MRSWVRWSVALGVTVAAFAVPTWLCGAFILSPVLKDSGTRWGLAGGVGVAVAALAALWGHGFSTDEPEDPHSEPAKAPSGDSAQAAQSQSSAAFRGSPGMRIQNITARDRSTVYSVQDGDLHIDSSGTANGRQGQEPGAPGEHGQ